MPWVCTSDWPPLAKPVPSRSRGITSRRAWILVLHSGQLEAFPDSSSGLVTRVAVHDAQKTCPQGRSTYVWDTFVYSFLQQGQNVWSWPSLGRMLKQTWIRCLARSLWGLVAVHSVVEARSGLLLAPWSCTWGAMFGSQKAGMEDAASEDSALLRGMSPISSCFRLLPGAIRDSLRSKVATRLASALALTCAASLCSSWA